MTKDFEERVKREGYVEARKYDYRYEENAEEAYIERIERNSAGRWETVKYYNFKEYGVCTVDPWDNDETEWYPTFNSALRAAKKLARHLHDGEYAYIMAFDRNGECAWDYTLDIDCNGCQYENGVHLWA